MSCDVNHVVHARVLRHRPLSDAIAQGFVARMPRFVDRDDVHAAAYFGLVQAAGRFDASYGVPFGAYARLRITGSVRDWLRVLDPLTRDQRRRLRATGVVEYVVRPVAVCDAHVADVSAPGVDELVVAHEKIRFMHSAVLALPPSLARVLPCRDGHVPLRTLAATYGVSVATVSRQRTVARRWLHTAVAWYDGTPAAVPCETPVRQYLHRVAGLAGAWRVS